MSEAIIVAAADAAERIRSLVEPESIRCTAAYSAAEAIPLLMSREFELAIINTSTCGEDSSSLALTASRSGAGTILLAQKSEADRLAAELVPKGIAVLERPISRSLFRQAVRLMDASRRHVEGYRSELIRLRAQLDETKLIDRAKCVLIQYLGLDEGDAHRYIEKQSMDMRLSRREIAENILKTYES